MVSKCFITYQLPVQQFGDQDQCVKIECQLAQKKGAVIALGGARTRDRQIKSLTPIVISSIQNRSRTLPIELPGPYWLKLKFENVLVDATAFGNLCENVANWARDFLFTTTNFS